MAYISLANYYTHNHKTWPVNSRPSGFYTQYLKRIIEQLEAMLSHHNKIFVFRMDLSMNTAGYTPDNAPVSQFMRSFRHCVETHYQLPRSGYAWSRELSNATSQHYHLLVMLDGNRVQNPRHAYTYAADLWRANGRTWLPENPSYTVKRGDDTALADLIYRASYLAKGKDKGHKALQAKNFGSSRLKFKRQKNSSYLK